MIATSAHRDGRITFYHIYALFFLHQKLYIHLYIPKHELGLPESEYIGSSDESTCMYI